jgi:hypothetical protein
MSDRTTLSEGSYDKEMKCLFKVSKQIEGSHVKYCQGKHREGRWSREEHKIFLEEIIKIGIKNWKKVNFSQLTLFSSKIKYRQGLTARFAPTFRSTSKGSSRNLI